MRLYEMTIGQAALVAFLSGLGWNVGRWVADLGAWIVSGSRRER